MRGVAHRVMLLLRKQNVETEQLRLRFAHPEPTPLLPKAMAGASDHKIHLDDNLYANLEALTWVPVAVV